MSDIRRAVKLLESRGYRVTKDEIEYLQESEDNILAGYNINSPLVFSSYEEFSLFMEEVIEE